MAGPALLQQVLTVHGVSALACATWSIPGCVRVDLRTVLVVAAATALFSHAIPRKSQGRPAMSSTEEGGNRTVRVTRRYRDGLDGTSGDSGALTSSLSVFARRPGPRTRPRSPDSRH